VLTKDDFFLTVDPRSVLQYYDSFSWLIPGYLSLDIFFVTVFGEPVFCKSDKSVHKLDLISGKVKMISEDIFEFEGLLSHKKFQESNFHSNLLTSLKSAGLSTVGGKIFSFIHPPILGGKIEIENIELSDFDVAISVLGQIHSKIHQLPSGTKVKIL
jgi:hypothetical protein